MTTNENDYVYPRDDGTSVPAVTYHLWKGASLGSVGALNTPYVATVKADRDDLAKCEAVLDRPPLTIMPSKFVRGGKNEIVLVWTYADRYALLEAGGLGEYAVLMATRGDAEAMVYRFPLDQLEGALSAIQTHLRPQKVAEPASGAPAAEWPIQELLRPKPWPGYSEPLTAFYNTVLGEPWTVPADMMA